MSDVAMVVDIVAEDSGNYSCEVRGPQSNVLHNIMHYVYVRSQCPTPLYRSRSIIIRPSVL